VERQHLVIHLYKQLWVDLVAVAVVAQLLLVLVVDTPAAVVDIEV
jgi:hypothetical protein